MRGREFHFDSFDTKKKKKKKKKKMLSQKRCPRCRLRTLSMTQSIRAIYISLVDLSQRVPDSIPQLIRPSASIFHSTSKKYPQKMYTEKERKKERKKEAVGHFDVV